MKTVKELLNESLGDDEMWIKSYNYNASKLAKKLHEPGLSNDEKIRIQRKIAQLHGMRDELLAKKYKK